MGVQRCWTILGATGLVLASLITTDMAQGAAPSPAWVEHSDSDGVRMRIQKSTDIVKPKGFVGINRGPFIFPKPYNTQGVRITDASDCTGAGIPADCISYVGYSYWRNSNNHPADTAHPNRMLIFLGVNGKATLFEFDKSSRQVTKQGMILNNSSDIGKETFQDGNVWYFSAI